MSVFNMCVSKLCVFKKFVSKKLGSFQDVLVKMLAFMGVVTGMFFMGNTVSDPSSVIDALKAFNTTSTPLTCDANQLAHHYKTLAFDVTFLSIAMALAACVVCCVKFIVDAGAEEQKQPEADPVAAALKNAKAAVAAALKNAMTAALEAEADAIQAETDAKRAVREKQDDLEAALRVATDARSKANQAMEAALVAEAKANTNPADDVVVATVQEKFDDAAMAAGQADKDEELAEKAKEHLKEAEDDADQKKTAAREATKSAEDATKTADAAEPKTGMARFPCWLSWTLRAFVLCAAAVSMYSCIVAIDSFTELLEYKTGCVRFEGDSQSRHAALAYRLVHLQGLSVCRIRRPPSHVCDWGLLH